MLTKQRQETTMELGLCLWWEALIPVFATFTLVLAILLHAATSRYLPTFSEIKTWDFYPGSAGILKTTRSLPKIPEEVRSLPKTSEVFWRRRKADFPAPVLGRVSWTWARSQCFSLQKSEIARKVLSFIHFTHGFRSLHGSELTYFRKLCQARR